MPRNQQYLMGALVAAVALYFGSRWFSSTVLGPFQTRSEELARLNKNLDLKREQQVALSRSKSQLKTWRERSLPPDPVKAKQRPDALNAQRLYLEWLTDLAQLSGFEDLKVSPDKTSVKPGMYVAVTIKIEADARFEQLCNFLDRFYRTNLLHRVTSLRVQSKESEGDPFFQVTLLAEGLALLDAPQRRTLFPQTQLAEELTDDATTLKVAAADGFPKQPGFRVRMKNEFLTVTKIDGTTWTVERGVDRTTASEYPDGTTIELMPLIASIPSRTADEFQELLEANIFVKPAPPTKVNFRFGTLSEKTHTRGKPFELTIPVLGYDNTKGKPEFALVGTSPAGVQLDKSTGKLVWKPDDDQKAGKYTIKFEARHPSAPDGKLSGSLTVALRDANTPPKFADKPAPPVYLGREWKFTPEAKDSESSLSKLTWKLGENPPAGLAIDEKTGELTWTPEESIPIGETTVNVTATDDGMPPQSTTLELKLDVQDDAATFTRLVGIFAQDDARRAILYDRSQDKRTELREGDPIAVADVKGTVTSITTRHVLFAEGKEVRRLEVGQSLREATLEEAELPDATKPANVDAH